MMEEEKTGFCPFCVEEIKLTRLDGSDWVFIEHKPNPDTEPDTKSDGLCKASGHTPLQAAVMYESQPIRSLEDNCSLPSELHLGE